MNKLAALFATTALALSGAVLADNVANADSPSPGAQAVPQSPGDAQAPDGEVSSNPTKGFMLLQRNIYVPVDAEGKATSKELIVVDKQGYVTAEELGAQAPAGNDRDGDENANPATNDNGGAAGSNGGAATDNGGVGKAQPAPSGDGSQALPSPTWKDVLPGAGRGPLIQS